MREPKLIYSCAPSELIGRRVRNQDGAEGTIIRVFDGEDAEMTDYPIKVVFVGDWWITYMLDGYERKNSDGCFITLLTEEPQSQQETGVEEYKECINLIRGTHKCSILKALEIYKDLSN